jgi:type II secretory pathway pseudopilin PulG
MLVEVLVGMILMSIVGMLVLDGIAGGFRAQRQLTDRSEALSKARQAAQRITREIREANPVLTAQAGKLVVRRSDGANGYVTTTYEQAGTVLNQTVTTTSASGVSTTGATVPAIDSLDGTTLPFTYEQVPGYTAPAGVTLVSGSCALSGVTPLTYLPDCVGKVTLKLVRTVKNHTSVTLEATVDLRNRS